MRQHKIWLAAVAICASTAASAGTDDRLYVQVIKGGMVCTDFIAVNEQAARLRAGDRQNPANRCGFMDEQSARLPMADHVGEFVSYMGSNGKLYWSHQDHVILPGQEKSKANTKFTIKKGSVVCRGWSVISDYFAGRHNVLKDTWCMTLVKDEAVDTSEIQDTDPQGGKFVSFDRDYKTFWVRKVDLE